MSTTDEHTEVDFVEGMSDVTLTTQIDLSEDLLPPGDHHPSLLVQIPNRKEEIFTLSGKKLIEVGREQADIILPHRSVSASHCTFSLEGGVVFLMDDGSTNGTFLNGEKLTPHRQVIVGEGDQIYMGQVPGQIRIPSPSSNVPPSTPPKPQQQTPRSPPEKKKKTWMDQLTKNRKQEENQKPNLTHPLFRLWATIGDGAFNHFLVALLLPLPFAQHLVGEFEQFWPTGAAALVHKLFPQAALGALIFWVLIFFVFRLTCVLLFGVGLAQAAMGLWGGSGLLYNRLGGAIRVGLEFLLGGFLIFDLPLLWNMPSAKEFLSRTAIVNGPLALRIFSSITVIPCMIVLAFTGSFISQWPYHQGLAVTKYQLPPLPESGTFRSFKLNSTVFQLSGTPRIDPQRFILLLSYEITSQNKRKTFRPRLTLFDRKIKQAATFKIHSPNILLQALQAAFANNSFMNGRYPKISSLLTRSEGPSSEEERTAVGQLLEQALALNIDLLIDKIKNANLAISGLIQLRQTLIDHFELNPLSQMQWLQANDHLFLKINPRSLEDRLVKNYLLAMGDFHRPIYELTYFDRDRGAVVAASLLQYLFEEGDDYGEGVAIGQYIDNLINSQMSYEQIAPLYNDYLTYIREVVDSVQSREEQKFLAGQLSSLGEVDRLLSRRHPQWAEQFAGRGFQAQLDRLNHRGGQE